MGEIQLYIEVFAQREKDRQKSRAIDIYNLAQLTAIGMGVYHPFSDAKNKFPQITECFPDLFHDEKKKIKQQDWRIAKERLLKFAENHNKNMGGRDG